MQLKFKRGKLIIDILGYEFLSSKHKEDLNWLELSILLEDKNRYWKVKGPYLRTEELDRLLLWFRDLKDNKTPSQKRLSFLEKELAFSLSENDLDIIVSLAYNFYPVYGPYDPFEGKTYELIFPIKDLNINTIVKSLIDLTSSYPSRSSF